MDYLDKRRINIKLCRINNIRRTLNILIKLECGLSSIIRFGINEDRVMLYNSIEVNKNN